VAVHTVSRRKGSRGISTQLELYRSGNAKLVRQVTRALSDEEIRIRNLDLLLRRYVVKKHRASRLHYDFRLEWNGVLLSWAMPVGPSLCPLHHPEAIQMEDHRPKYWDFEGVIAQGKPGAGPMIVWDCGTWRPQTQDFDVDAGLQNGALQFTLFGKKLMGNWVLTRIERRRDRDGNPMWELVKEADEFARDSNAVSILKEQPDSALNGKSLEKVEREWNEGKSKADTGPSLFD
jgi:bifunctional non-homologous end joining protein LigD